MPVYPPPTTGAADDKRPLAGLPKGPDCREALGDLPDADGLTGRWTKRMRFGRLRLRSRRRMQRSFVASRTKGRGTSPVTFEIGILSMLTSSARTTHTSISKRRFAETKPGSALNRSAAFFAYPPTGCRIRFAQAAGRRQRGVYQSSADPLRVSGDA